MELIKDAITTLIWGVTVLASVFYAVCFLSLPVLGAIACFKYLFN